MRCRHRLLEGTLSRRELLAAALFAAPAACLACSSEGGDEMETTLTPGPADFESDGLRLHYEIAGSGPPLVVLHGWANSYRGFFVDNGWLDVLGPVRTIIGIDQRGHGASDKRHEPEAYAPERMAGDVVMLLDELGVDTTDVFGYSMGGLVTATLLTHHRERVSAAVLGGVGGNLFSTDQSTLKALYQPMIDALLAENLDDLQIEALRNVRAYYEEIGNDRIALAAWMQAGHYAGSPKLLEGLEIPVLVCNSEADAEGPIVASAIPGADFETIPGTNHITVVPDQRYKDRILRFFNEVDAARAS